MPSALSCCRLFARNFASSRANADIDDDISSACEVDSDASTAGDPFPRAGPFAAAGPSNAAFGPLSRSSRNAKSIARADAAEVLGAVRALEALWSARGCSEVDHRADPDPVHVAAGIGIAGCGRGGAASASVCGIPFIGRIGGGIGIGWCENGVRMCPGPPRASSSVRCSRVSARARAREERIASEVDRLVTAQQVISDGKR